MANLRGVVTTISASSAKTTSGNSGTISFLDGAGPVEAVQFILNVTASSAPTTLDVYLQHSPNTGTTWYDFGHFKQVGAVSTSIQSLTWQRRPQGTNAGGATETQTLVTGDAALGGAADANGTVINGPIVDNYFRAKWVIVGTSYTFSLIAVSDQD